MVLNFGITSVETHCICVSHIVNIAIIYLFIKSRLKRKR